MIQGKPFRKHLALALLLPFIATCGGNGDEYQGFDPNLKISTPNKFMIYLNRQGELAAGDYTLVVATKVALQSGSFSVNIRRNNGSTTQVINDSWTSSGGADSDPNCASGNRCYPIDLQDATGVTFELSTVLDGILYLVDDSVTPQVIASADASGVGGNESLAFSASNFDESKYASAYYAAIDPSNARDTLQKFIALHGLDSPDARVIFRDSKDVGYGRDLYMVSYDNTTATASTCPGHTIALYVRNFSVNVVGSLSYGPVNLSAAIDNDLQYHFGSNAIEFGTGRDDVGDTCSSEPMAKFYTFRSDYSTPGAPHPRLLRIDLDGRGEKAMPQPCITCHGGKMRPLDRFDRFVAVHALDATDQIGDVKARLQALEANTFEYSNKTGFRRADQEEDLRKINNAIFCTYPGSNTPACTAFGGGVPAQTSPGEWSGDFAREVLSGWYGGAIETVGSSFDKSFVPVGWRPSVGGPPVGVDTLFTKVIGPNCFICHGKRGTELGSSSNASGDGQDLDFSTWDKFISHADQIERLVYDEGRMPLGLPNFLDFWSDPEKGELLASFIAPFVSDVSGFASRRTDALGNIIEPGRVVARAGPDRVTRQNAGITLNAQASLFADTYRWQLLSSPPGSTVSLSRPTSMRTGFTADTDGEYMIRLTASASPSGSSKTDDLSVLVDSALTTAPRELNFYSHIATQLNTCATQCHSTGGGTSGGSVASLPVWWVTDAAQPAGSGTGVPLNINDTPALGFYEQVMARVNLEHIEDSPILKVSSGQHHYGDIGAGFDSSLGVGAAGRSDYDLFVNWIAEGAVCGGTPVQCPE